MLMRHSMLLVPGLLLVGCGDTPQALTTDEPAPIEDHDSDKADDIPQDSPAIVADALVYPDSCEAPSVYHEGSAYRLDPNALPLTDYACRWTFDDGHVSTDCIGRHTFAEPGLHSATLEVEDLVFGGTATATVERDVKGPIEASLEATAPACGLEISYTGAVVVATETNVFVEPAAQVVLDDPNYHLQLVNTVRVTQPGVYTVRLRAEDERSDGNSCSKEVVKEVTVVACGDDGGDGGGGSGSGGDDGGGEGSGGGSGSGDDHEHDGGCGH